MLELTGVACFATNISVRPFCDLVMFGCQSGQCFSEVKMSKPEGAAGPTDPRLMDSYDLKQRGGLDVEFNGVSTRFQRRS